jgi:hypothetical protein
MLVTACEDAARRDPSPLDRARAWVGVSHRPMRHALGTPLPCRVTTSRVRPGDYRPPWAVMPARRAAQQSGDDRACARIGLWLGAEWARITEE